VGAQLPSLFVSHGAPTLPLEESPARSFLQALGAEIPRPRAILAVSAHWETEHPAVSLSSRPETIHDFFGFPRALYELRYAAPGAPELAKEAAALLEGRGFEVEYDPARGLDHGAWTPLMLMYPEADIPVTQLSVQPQLGPAHHWQLGEALRPLRGDGVLVFASGSATHNLREFRMHARDGEAAAWAQEFGEWLAHALETRSDDALIHYRERAPQAARNHPTDEHLLPVFVAAGAATPGVPATRIHTSYTYGVIGMDAYRFD
jgi:4,5-DOPA dioxygenase extradiol